MGKLTGKIAIVTGASRGIGRGIAAAVEDTEPMIPVADIAEVALLMATLPPNVEMLEATVLPHEQKYVGRG